ncbi:hypothetical protein B0I00_2122 [Novosphingobium kunmingense]|uniref:Uncharacterized protein n=1 Tax=Novosphingobium kunmingense TaxID=1211806 RepID=A0A2N0H6I2_9SPHN|nr:hypothetical protein [Novosphingobium kunmingense]PKB14532.1 hypothetical protein B0I00_2122 [Novosphingobium kunmingense]
MTPPRSFIGTFAEFRWFARFKWRALVFLPPIVALLLLAVFPERYRAATSLTPADPESLGLSGTLGQLGAFNSVFGNQAAVEVAMRVAKSVAVREGVIKVAKLEQRLNQSNDLKLHRWLEDRVTIRSLRGGIISIEMSLADADLARTIVGAYVTETQSRLAEISRGQTAYKRDVLFKLTTDASDRLAKAQADFDNFRLRARYADPRSSMEAIGERVPKLEVAIKAKQVQIDAAREMFTDQNVMVKQLLAEMNTLQSQLAEAKTTDPRSSESVGRLVTQSSQLFKLERELGISKALYDSYMRYLQGTAVEDLTSTANMRVLEPPYVDTDRQYRLPALAGAIVLLLLWLAIEFYRLRPPVGALRYRELHADPQEA